MKHLPRMSAKDGRQPKIAAHVRNLPVAGSGVSLVPPTAAADDTGTEVATQVTAELWLYGVVGGWWFGFDSDTVAWALTQMPEDVTHVNVRVHSPGGNAFEGVAIGNLLSNHPAHMRVIVDGLAASAASVIALGGDEVVMSPGSLFMIHDASLLTYGNAAELRSDAEFLDKISRNIAEVYAYRAGGSAQEWRELMVADQGGGTWYTAQEAVDAGLATSVGNIAAVGTPPAEPVPEEFEDSDARAAFDMDIQIHSAARQVWTSSRGPNDGRRPNKPPSASADGSPEKEGADMSFIDDVRNRLGIAEDADEATTVAALDEVLAEQTETAQQNKPGTSVISDAELATLRSNAAAGADAAKRLHAKDREEVLNQNRTKFPAALRDSWAKQYDLDPEATTKALTEMPAIIPTTEFGHGDDPETPANVREDEGYKNWKV